MKPPTQISAQGRLFFLVTLFWAVLLWRSPNLLLYPRLWAEEGTFYYFSLQERGFTSTFSLIIRGNFQLLTNWITYLATIAPAKHAAYVTTYLSMLLTGIFAGLFGLLSIQRNWSLLLSGVTVTTLALLPHGYELYLTATNVQWLCSVSVLLIAILDSRKWNRFQRTPFYIFAIISGLTGVCSVMLAPIFLLRMRFSPSQFHVKIGAILSTCAVVHVVIILGNAHPGRAFSSDLFTLTFPLVLQSIWSPIFGGGIVDHTVKLLNGEGRHWTWISIIYLASLFLVAFVVLSARIALRDTYLPLILLGAWIYVSMLNVLGSIGDPNGLISGWSGGRYFFLGAVCFVVLLVLVASGEPSVESKFAYLILVVMMASGISQIYRGEWKNWLISGRSWRMTVNLCEDVRPCIVEVWPGGPAWAFQLRRQ